MKADRQRPFQMYCPIHCPFGQFIRWHVIGFHCSLDSMCVSHLVLDSIGVSYYRGVHEWLGIVERQWGVMLAALFESSG